MYKLFRQTTAAIAAVALMTGCATNLEAASENGSAGVSTHEVAPGVYSFLSDSGYHSMFAVTDDGVAAFETVNSKHSIDMLKAIRKITDKPVKYALQTHNHWDHSSGGAVMQATGAKVVMHSLAANWLAENPGRDTSPPDIVWDGTRKDIELGDMTIQMHQMGLSHGLGMTVYVIPERSIAYIGDLVTPNRVMFSLVPDFNINEWERTLSEMMELDFDVAVCSHNDLPAGEAIKGCTMEHVKEEHAFIGDLRNAIFAEFKKGTNPGAIPSVVSLPQYSHWNHYDDWLALNAQRMLLDLWMGPY